MRCGVEFAALRAEPAESAEQVTQVLRGEELRVKERRGGWALVRTDYDYPGWIRESDLVGGAPLDLARTFVGTPYEWGGMTSAGIDCSGLVHMAFRLAGRLVPRDAWQQAEAGKVVAEPVAGDIVVYGEPVDHVAFWVGDGRILHATGREETRAVVEEEEPAALKERPRRVVRL